MESAYIDKNIEKLKRGLMHKKMQIRKRKKESEKIKIKFNNISDTIKGFKKLQNFTWRNTYIYILNCFREKIKDRKKSKLMTVIIKIKEKNNNKNGI